jgi:transcriptional regulator with XRE-family HTH domain
VAKRQTPKGAAVAARRRWDGRRIREVREARGVSQKTLAEASGLSEGDISRHERNDEKSNPSVDSLVRLSTALHVPTATLLEPVGTPIPRPDEESGDAQGQPTTRRPRQDHPILQAQIDKLDMEMPAEHTWRGDVLKAIGVLDRALRRPDPGSIAPPITKTRS